MRLLRLAAPILAASLVGCARLEELPYEPPTTPQEWCQQRPCVDVGGIVLNEPLGTFLVFALSIGWVLLGLAFLRSRAGQQARTWMGIALVLGGIGAVLAGISYQAFSYALKCADRELCVLTNGFEVGYSITQAASVSAMVAAVAFAAATGAVRRWVLAYSVVNVVGYLVISIVGVLLVSAVLLSFEVLMLFAVPGLIAAITLATRGYRATGSPMLRQLLTAAWLLVAVQVAYFSYSAAGITQALWDGGNGFYFSENDVLHVGMILWLIYVWRTLYRTLRDYESG